MYECPECGEKINEEDVEFECPFCGETDPGEGFYTCENCGTLFDYLEDLWKCKYCHNEGMNRFRCQNIDYDEFDDDYCEDYNSDVNQGWVGEHYG